MRVSESQKEREQWNLLESKEKVVSDELICRNEWFCLNQKTREWCNLSKSATMRIGARFVSNFNQKEWDWERDLWPKRIGVPLGVYEI